MEFNNSYHEHENSKKIKVNAYPKIYDAKDSGYLNIIQNTKQFCNEEKLVLNDDFEYIETNHVECYKISKARKSVKGDITTNNLVDINSMFIEFTGVINFVIPATTGLVDPVDPIDPEPVEPEPIRQWAIAAKAESEEAANDQYAYKLIGEPDFYPRYGVNSQAWAPRFPVQPDVKSHWFEVTYATPIRIQQMNVYNTFRGGCIFRLDAYDAEAQKWETVWRSDDRGYVTVASIFTINVDDYARYADTYRVYIDFTLSTSNNSAPFAANVDAVEIVGLPKAGLQPRSKVVTSKNYFLDGSRLSFLKTRHTYELYNELAVDKEINNETTLAVADPAAGNVMFVRPCKINRSLHVGCPSFFQTIPVKTFRTYLGNNQQIIENWEFSTQLAMNTIQSQSEKNVHLFGKNNVMTGVQELPDPLKKLLNELEALLLYSSEDAQKSISYPFKLNMPLNLVSQIFVNRKNVLFWPTGTPLSIEMELRDYAPLVVDHMSYITQDSFNKATYSKMGQLGGSLLFTTESVKIYYNEYILKPQVKEILNLKLLKEPRIYHYVKPQVYLQQCDSIKTVFSQVITLNNTIPTEIIIFASLWDQSIDDTFRYGYQDTVVDAFNSKSVNANIDEPYWSAGVQTNFSYPDRPSPSTILKHIKLTRTGREAVAVNNYDFEFHITSDALQQDIQTQNLYDGTGVSIKNNYFTSAQYHRIVISPKHDFNSSSVAQSVDNKSIKIEVELACNNFDSLFEKLQPISADHQVQFVIPTPAQYEIDITRNVNLYKYPSLIVDQGYTHTNISQINID